MAKGEIKKKDYLKRQWTAQEWHDNGCNEADLQKFLIQELSKTMGVYVVKVQKGNRVGIPDLLVCAEGRFVGAELKSVTGKPSLPQLSEIHGIKEAGGHAGIVRTWKEMVQLLRDAGFNCPDEWWRNW